MSAIISAVMTASGIRACSSVMVTAFLSTTLVLRFPSLLEGGDGLGEVVRRHRRPLEGERQIEDLPGPGVEQWKEPRPGQPNWMPEKQPITKDGGATGAP